MAFLGVWPSLWVRCKAHNVVFAAHDPIWSRDHHNNCGMDTIEFWERPWFVVLINELGYDPRDRDLQRVLMCSECGGHGTVVGLGPSVSWGSRYAKKLVELTCESCGGKGYR